MKKIIAILVMASFLFCVGNEVAASPGTGNIVKEYASHNSTASAEIQHPIVIPSGNVAVLERTVCLDKPVPSESKAITWRMQDKLSHYKSPPLQEPYIAYGLRC